MPRLLGLLERAGNWKLVFFLLLLGLGCLVMFRVRREKLLEYSGGLSMDQGKVLDARYRGYTPDQARSFLERLGPDGRKFYAITEVSLDLLFPLTYGALLAIFLRRLYPNGPAWPAIVPLGALACDLLENATIVTLISRYDGSESGLAWIAAGSTVAKSIFLLASFALILFGVVRRFQAERSRA